MVGMKKKDKLKILKGYYIKNFDRLCKQRSRWVGSLHNAEDAVQEGFARSLKYIDSWKEGPFEHWNNTVLNNACRDIKKQERLQGGVKEPEDLEEGATDSADDLQFTEQMACVILKEMSAKPMDNHSVLRDYIVFGYTCKEIAEYIDMSQANIRKIVQRFKEEMVQKYGKDMCFGPGS